MKQIKTGIHNKICRLQSRNWYNANYISLITIKELIKFNPDTRIHEVI